MKPPLHIDLWMRLTNSFRRRKRSYIHTMPVITTGADGHHVVTGGTFLFPGKSFFRWWQKGIAWEIRDDGSNFVGGYSIEELLKMQKP